MNRLLATAATVAFLGAGTAFAQTTEMPLGDVHGNIAAMEASVSAELARMGISAEVDDLTLRQLSELSLILNDESLSVDDRIDQARQVIEVNGEDPA